MKRLQLILIFLLLSSMLVLSSCSVDNLGGKATESLDSVVMTDVVMNDPVVSTDDGSSVKDSDLSLDDSKEDSSISEKEDSSSLDDGSLKPSEVSVTDKDETVDEGDAKPVDEDDFNTEDELSPEELDYNKLMSIAEDYYAKAIKSEVYDIDLFMKSLDAYKEASNYKFADQDFIKKISTKIILIMDLTKEAQLTFTEKLLSDDTFNYGIFELVLDSNKKILDIENTLVYVKVSIDNVNRMANEVQEAMKFDEKKDFFSAKDAYTSILNNYGAYVFANIRLESIQETISTYDELISKADSILTKSQESIKFDEDGFKKSIAAYTFAIDVISEETYAHIKIDNIKKFLDLGTSYNSKIFEANYLYSLKTVDSMKKAVDLFIEASKIHPEEVYPKDMAIEIQAKLDLMEKYFNAMLAASELKLKAFGNEVYNGRLYDNAITAFKKAGELVGEDDSSWSNEIELINDWLDIGEDFLIPYHIANHLYILEKYEDCLENYKKAYSYHKMYFIETRITELEAILDSMNSDDGDDLSILGTAQSVIMVPEEGTYYTRNALNFELNTAEKKALIRYTLDDSEVTENSDIYTEPFKFDYGTEVEIRTKVFKTQFNPSEEMIFHLNIKRKSGGHSSHSNSVVVYEDPEGSVNSIYINPITGNLNLSSLIHISKDEAEELIGDNEVVVETTKESDTNFVQEETDAKLNAEELKEDYSKPTGFFASFAYFFKSLFGGI